MVHMAIPGDLLQHLSGNGMGTNRRFTADASKGGAYMETLAFVSPSPEMRIDLPRSESVLAGAVDMALFIFFLPDPHQHGSFRPIFADMCRLPDALPDQMSCRKADQFTREAPHTFVCKRLTVPARCRVKAGRFGPTKHARMVPSWPKHLVWCGRGDLNPHDLLGSADFHTTSAFAAPPKRVRGLDYPFTLLRRRFRCCPSSLYTFPEVLPGLARDCHSRFPRL